MAKTVNRVSIEVGGRGGVHHIALDEVEAERDLLDALVDAVDALFGVGEDDVGLLVVAGHGALWGGGSG